jgi:hypothetical protein
MRNEELKMRNEKVQIQETECDNWNLIMLARRSPGVGG